MTVPDAPGPAVLVYLFADAEVPLDTAMTRGVSVPCREARVQRSALAVELFAVALWSLRDSGAVTMRHESRRKRLGGTREVALIAATAAAAPSTSPLITGLFAACGVTEGEVVTVVRDWYGADVPDPVVPVLATVEGEATDLGLFEPARKRFLRRATLGEPHCERIAALRPAFDRLVEGWRRFKAAEPDLFAALTDGIRSGMASRVDEAVFFD